MSVMKINKDFVLDIFYSLPIMIFLGVISFLAIIVSSVTVNYITDVKVIDKWSENGVLFSDYRVKVINNKGETAIYHAYYCYDDLNVNQCYDFTFHGLNREIKN